jgi:hypothetical protein
MPSKTTRPRLSSDRRWRTMITALGVVSVLFVPVLRAGGRPVRIYVFTQPSQFVDEESKRRNDSVSDLKGALSQKHHELFRRPLEIAVVEKREDADLVLEVINSRWEVRGKTAIIDSQGNLTAEIGSAASGDATVRAVLSRDTYRLELVGTSPGAVRQWHFAASSVSDQVQDWVNDNGAQIAK